MAPPTTTKGVRLTPHELERFTFLRRFYPEAANESDMIRIAAQRGLALMEAEVVASGGELPSGVREEDLATMMVPRLAATFLWLIRLGRLTGVAPSVSGAAIIDPAGITAAVPPKADNELIEIDLTAADDVTRLGGDFLGGWDDMFDEEEE